MWTGPALLLTSSWDLQELLNTPEPVSLPVPGEKPHAFGLSAYIQGLISSYYESESTLNNNMKSDDRE